MRPPSVLGLDLTWPEGAPLSEFGRTLGAMVVREVAGTRVTGIEASRPLSNEAGWLHGGAMTGFIDEAVGTIVARATGRPHVTVQLNAAFLKPVQMGDLIVPSCQITALTGSMTFVEARLRVGNDVVLTASMIFKAVRTEG